MGRMIGGVYTPSYADILKERYVLQQTLEEQKRAREEASYRREVSEEQRGMQREKFAMEKERFAAEKKMEGAKLDYWKAKALNEQLSKPDAEKPAELKDITQSDLKVFSSYLTSGMIKQAETLARGIGLIDPNASISKTEDGYMVESPKGSYEITLGGVMEMGGMKTKEDVENVVKQRNDALKKTTSILDEYNREVSEIARQERYFKDSTMQTSSGQLVPVQGGKKGMSPAEAKAARAKIAEKYKRRFVKAVVEDKGLADEAKVPAIDLFEQETGSKVESTIRRKIKINQPQEYPMPGAQVTPDLSAYMTYTGD